MSSGSRLGRLLDECRKAGMDGVIILPGPNMRYLIDFTLEVFERPAFLLAGFGGRSTLLVPQLDEERAREAVGSVCDVASYSDETGPWKW
ncbi:MAG: aminopeptidase P family N-terminal domain-containing protein, partial [Nitrososphaerota archaeon]